MSYAGRVLSKIELSCPVAWLVMRDRFDNFLVERVVVAGAELIEGDWVRKVDQDEKGVIVRTESDYYRGSPLVGADRVNSWAGRSAGLFTKR